MSLRETTKFAVCRSPQCGRSERCTATYNYRGPSFEQGFVLARITANSVRHKIAFLANGCSLNNVKWVCNDFETRPGAIDRLSQWKGSHCFDREQTAFHSKCDWACGVSSFISELAINRQRNSIVAYVSVFFFFLYVYLHISSMCIYSTVCVGRASCVSVLLSWCHILLFD